MSIIADIINEILEANATRIYSKHSSLINLCQVAILEAFGLWQSWSIKSYITFKFLVASL